MSESRTVTLKCPTCHERVALWDGRTLAMARGRQRVKVRRGSRGDTVRATSQRWAWRRMWACWADEDGTHWHFGLSHDTGPVHQFNLNDLEQAVALCGFGCCGNSFTVRSAIAAGKRAERLGRGSTHLPVPSSRMRDN